MFFDNFFWYVHNTCRPRIQIFCIRTMYLNKKRAWENKTLYTEQIYTHQHLHSVTPDTCTRTSTNTYTSSVSFLQVQVHVYLSGQTDREDWLTDRRTDDQAVGIAQILLDFLCCVRMTISFMFCCCFTLSNTAFVFVVCLLAFSSSMRIIIDFSLISRHPKIFSIHKTK